MARFCRFCGSSLMNEDGSTDYDHQFCPDKDCRKKDKAQLLRDTRAADIKRGRCSSCGQKIFSAEIWRIIRTIAKNIGVEL